MTLRWYVFPLLSSARKKYKPSGRSVVRTSLEDPLLVNEYINLPLLLKISTLVNKLDSCNDSMLIRPSLGCGNTRICSFLSLAVKGMSLDDNGDSRGKSYL